MAHHKSTNVLTEPRVTGMGNMEDQIDEDFLFYLSLTKTYFSNLVENSDIDLCQAWLNKLCGQKVTGVEAKQVRNIYLSNLILAMQEGQLQEPFERAPPEGALRNPNGVFGPTQPDIEIEEPAWLKEVKEGGDGIDFQHHSRDGRVYLASKSLENGKGAFGYLAVTIGKDSQKGAGPLHDLRLPSYADVTAHEAAADGDLLTAQIKELLSKRCTKAERKRLLRYFEDVILSAKEELAGRGRANSNAEKLMAESQRRGGSSSGDRQAALRDVIQKVERRLSEVKAREALLDGLQEKIRGGSTEDEQILEQSWLGMCKTDFAKRNLDKINALYPQCVVERFLDLLREERMEMVKKHEKRYEEYQRECNREMEKAVKEYLKEYQRVQKDWEAVCPAVTSLKKSRIKFADEQKRRLKVKDDREKFQNQSSAESCKHLEALLEEIHKAQAALQAETGQSATISARIEETNAKVQRIVTGYRLAQEADADEHKRYRDQIEALRIEHRDQERRIAQLEQMAKTH